MPDTYQNPMPVCPHCGHALNIDELIAAEVIDGSGTGSGDDLFDLAVNEETAAIQCPVCDQQYWIKGGYRPHYTTAFAEEEL